MRHAHVIYGDFHRPQQHIYLTTQRVSRWSVTELNKYICLQTMAEAGSAQGMGGVPLIKVRYSIFFLSSINSTAINHGDGSWCDKVGAACVISYFLRRNNLVLRVCVGGFEISRTRIGGLRALGPPRQNLGPMNNLLDPLFAVESDFLIHFGVRLLFFVV